MFVLVGTFGHLLMETVLSSNGFKCENDSSNPIVLLRFENSNIVKLQVWSKVQVQVLVRVLVKVQCPVHGLDPGQNSGAQNSVYNSQKKGPGETL